MPSNAILCICHDFPPQLMAGAIKIGKLVEQLRKDWQVNAITSVRDGYLNSEITVHFVKSWSPHYLFAFLHKIKLHKLTNLFVWPDEAVFWTLPAVFKAMKLIRQQKPSAVVVFMMPYGAGLVGVIIKWMTGLPLVFNFDDSYNCTDMNSSFATWIHYKISYWLEDWYIRQADAVVYVSQRNLEAVRNRQPKNQHLKFYLVRCGADPEEFNYSNLDNKNRDEYFRIIYIGVMVGWFEFYPVKTNYGALRKLLAAWNKLGNYELVKLDLRSHSPIFIGQAVKQSLAQNPQWQGQIKVKIYGSTYPKSVTDCVLESQKVADVVEVHGVVPHAEAIQLACQSDLLFLTFADRPDGTPGGRISAKTYEYLMTDKPILAAVPQGENWDYLQDKPGVWLVKPTDVSAMTKVINELASLKLSGKSIDFDRTDIKIELSYENRAKEFSQVLDQVILLQ